MKEAKAHDTDFGTFHLNAQHPDYPSTVATGVLPMAPVIAQLRSYADTMHLVLQAVDRESGESLSGAWIVFELVRDPPCPVGPQRLALPASLRSDPFPVRAKVGVDGYRPVEVEWNLGAGTHRRDFELERVEDS